MSGHARRRLAAILAADVVGYSRMIRADEEGTLAALRALRTDLIDPKFAEYSGRIVKLMGDGMLVEFASVVDAVRAAVETQKAIAAHIVRLPEDQKIQFRIGINLGDVVIDGDDIHGDGVNVAARLEGLADPGGICVSGAVHDQVKNRLKVAFEDLGEREVKNIDEPVRVWRLSGHASAEQSAQTSGPALPDKPSIVVLPFENMSNDPEQGYFADGISEDIITDLSKVPGLFVIARNSSFAYKGQSYDIRRVCRDLGVRHFLEGSVRKAGGQVRINAQLIDGLSGGHLWANRYDRSLADIFAVQDEVTREIVMALQIRLVHDGSGPPTRAETDNPEAYDCVLRGREKYRLFTRDCNVAARLLFERAIELDPNYAAAFAAIAETYMQDWFLGSAEALDRAFALAQTAKDLDPSLPLVYEALSTVHLFKRQHDEAVATAERWLEMEPGSAEAHANLAGILHFAGNPEKVHGLVDKAKRLNPFYPFYYTLYIGQAWFTMNCFGKAAETIERSIAHNPEALPSYLYLAACYGQLGDVACAQQALAEARRISADFSMAQARTIFAYRRQADLDLLVNGLRKAGLTE